MTLDEAIRFSEEVAEELNEKACDLYENEDYENAKDCIWGAKEHRQLAKWLKELKDYRDARVGCEYCKHNYREQHERPCSLCQRNFMDMFERKVNADED